MQRHDAYGKRILSAAAGKAFCGAGPALVVDYGAGPLGRIDCVIDGRIAVEVESREPKQVRSAVLDLVCHTCPKKLLVVLPVNMNDPSATAAQCRRIFARFLPAGSFQTVVLGGYGGSPKAKADIRRVQRALRSLVFKNGRA
jgi:hypothetical protein